MKQVVKQDSWGRSVIHEIDEPKVSVGSRNLGPRPATPEEMKAWRETDYFNRGDYDPLVMFVVIPTVVQVMCMGMIFMVMALNQYLF